MKVEVSYTIYKTSKVEIPEIMVRELYNKFKHAVFIRSMILNALDEYIQQESGYLKDNGCYLEFLSNVEEWIDELVDKFKMEEY